ncbi:hypothetical protein V6Z11_A07G204200 [Gossypium hirsutum]
MFYFLPLVDIFPYLVESLLDKWNPNQLKWAGRVESSTAFCSITSNGEWLVCILHLHFSIQELRALLVIITLVVYQLIGAPTWP